MWGQRLEKLSQLKQQLEEKSYRLSIFQGFCRTVVSASSQEIKNLLFSSVGVITHSQDVSLALLHDDSLVFDGALGDVSRVKLMNSYKETPIWQSVLTGRPYYGVFIGDVPVSAVYPLVTKDGILGVLSIHTLQNLMDSDEREFLEALVSLAAVALQQAIRHEQAQEQVVVYQDKAIHDSLTGLNNRNFLQEYGTKEITRSIRHKTPFSVVMYDVDHFKVFNDNFGHPFGDLVLKNVAELTLDVLREEETAFRYGGEEFLLILSACTSSEGARVANRLRLSIEQHIFKDEEGTEAKVTASFGVARWMLGETLDEVISRADQALYRAKHEGRNRVRQWDKDKDQKQSKGDFI